VRRLDPVLLAGALFGLFGVAAGALGAHGLKARLGPDALEWWRTAAHYAQVHAVVLVALALGTRGAARRPAIVRVAALAFSLGIAIFSGTLVAMALGGPRMLGAVTPIGGLGLLVGWAALAVHALSARGGSPP
jgi:uncharacterized membrane protein YgdD (TMEM256/DUF423 family)